MEKPTSTIIDVLENYDRGYGVTSERALAMSIEEVDELAELVNQHYDAWSPLIDTDRLTVHPGYMAGRGLTEERQPMTNDLFSALLYFPRVVIHDPLSNWFNSDKSRLTISDGPRLREGQWWSSSSELAGGTVPYAVTRADLAETRNSLSLMLKTLEVLRPLIVEGIVLPVPQWRIVRQREQQIMTAIRHDVKDPELFKLITDSDGLFTVQDVGVQVGKMVMSGLPPGSEQRLAIEAPSFYFNKVISVASEVGAVYVPPLGTDYDLWRFKIDSVEHRVRMMSGRDPQIKHDLMKITIPVFGNVSAKNLVKVRRDEEAFDAFRQLITREFSLGYAVTDDLFPDAIVREVEDALRAQVDEVRKASSRSSILAAGRAGLPRHLAISGVTATIAQTIGPGLTGVTAATLGATGLAGAMYDMVFRPKLQGAKLVISGLLENR